MLCVSCRLFQRADDVDAIEAELTNRGIAVTVTSPGTSALTLAAIQACTDPRSVMQRLATALHHDPRTLRDVNIPAIVSHTAKLLTRFSVDSDDTIAFLHNIQAVCSMFPSVLSMASDRELASLLYGLGLMGTCPPELGEQLASVVFDRAGTMNEQVRCN